MRILASLSIALLLCIFQDGYGFLRQPVVRRGVSIRECTSGKESLLRLHFFGRKSDDKTDPTPNNKNVNKDKKSVATSGLQPPKNATDSSPSSPLFSFVKNISWSSVASGTIGGALMTCYVLFSTFSFIMPDQLQVFDPRVSTSISEPVTLFEDILVDLEKDYVDPIDPIKLFKTGMKAMLQSLDPYTEYEDLKAARNLQESVSGKYGGVGLVIANRKEDKSFVKTNFYRENTLPSDDKSVNNLLPNTNKPTKSTSNGVTIVDAFEGYAFNGGLRPGDRILKVDNIDCTEKNVEFVRDLLRGDPDTEVTVTYARDEYMDPKLFALTKQATAGTTQGVGEEKTSVIRETVLRRQLVKLSDIRLATLLGKPEDGIGYINLSGFNAGAGKDFRNALLMLRYSSPNDLNGLVLDLRGNPGGLLDAAVEIASYLVPEKSDIVSAKSKNGQEIIYRSVIAPIRPEKMKLVVIVNKGSASASEIVSGAIQDLDAGIIIGPSTTYGKGLVQKIIPLPFDAALKYTIARYYTPSGRCIQAVRYTGGRETLTASAAPSATTIDGDKSEKDKKSTPPLKIIKEQDTSSSIQHMQRALHESLLATATTDNRQAPPAAQPQEQQPQEEEEEEEDSSSPIFNPNKAASGVEIPDNERNIFYTLTNHRPVRDGGGIEPDLTVPPLKIGPAEGVLYTEGVYADFADDYLLKHNIRPSIKRAALRERISRDMDPRYQGANFGITIGQFFVVNHDIHAEKFRSLQFKTPQERELFLQQHAGDVFGFEVDSNELKLALQQEMQNEINEIDMYKSSAFDPLASGSKPQRLRSNAAAAIDTSSTAQTIGTNSQVPQQFFWGEAYTPKLEDQLFNDFRSYITTRIDNDDLQWERIFSGPLTKLEKRLKDAGFGSVLPELEKLKPQLKQAFLKDLENNKRFILDGLELALMNHELPGRLITYHTVIQDPQINTAMRLMRGEAIPSTTVETAAKAATAGGNGNLQASGAKKQIVEVDPPSSAAEITSSNIATSTVTYEQLLGANKAEGLTVN